MNPDEKPIHEQTKSHSNSLATATGHVLLIDDDEIFRRALSQLLIQRGFQVTQACDGHEAVTVFREKRPDVIICDIFMPSMEGLETISALRRVDPRVKIIAISGGGRIGAADSLKIAHKLGAFQTLLKPFESEELIRYIGEALPAIPEI